MDKIKIEHRNQMGLIELLELGLFAVHEDADNNDGSVDRWALGEILTLALRQAKLQNKSRE